MTPETLYGRDGEIALMNEWVRDIRDSGHALLIRGEAGIGKTSILDAGACAARSGGCRVLTVTGVESEAHLAFAGLHQLLRPVLRQVDQLPPPQRKAVLTAFGVLDGDPPAIFLVGLATLNLLADIAAEQPLLMVADDVQWLDTPTAEVLAFVGRRLGSDHILLLAAMRDGFQSPLVAARLPELVLEPLNKAPSAQLLDAQAPNLTEVARKRILDQAAGNPLALVELPRALRSERLADGPALPAILPLTDRLEQAFAAQASALPPATGAALLVAAVDDSPSASEVLAAAAHLTGAPVGVEVLEPAVQAGLITIIDGTIRFRHPLVRSALEQSAPVSRRNEAHAALARVLAGDPDRRAWHRAASIMGTDEDAAVELEAAARRAQDRGATVIAMAGEERAAALTEDPARRVGRLLAAAEMGFELGQPSAVRRLLVEAERSGPTPLDLARMTWLREIFNDGEPGNPMEVQRLVAASDEAVAAGDVSLALNLLRGAALRCWWADPGPAARDLVIEWVDRVVDARSEPRALEIMSLAAPVDRGAFVARRVALAAPLAAHDAAVSAMLGVTAHAVGDYGPAVDLLGRAAHGLRDQGRLGLLAQALIIRGWGCIHVGKLADAANDLDEGGRLAVETEQLIRASGAKIGQALLAGLRGEEDAAEALAREAEAAILPIRLGDLLAVLQLARGLTALGAGRHGDAFDHFRTVFDRVHPAFNELESFAVVGYLAESAVHAGRRDEARHMLVELERLGDRTPAALLHAGLRYARAALADEDAAEDLYAAALQADPGWPFDAARLQLAYGAWLRRRRRIAESRAPLRTARNAFDALGATPWGDRARQELRAAGEASPDRPVAAGRLSAQELQIAQLAAGGLSNREIAERLFLSHRTVGSHLYRIFPKLGIVSRSELRDALADPEPSLR